MPEEKCFQFYVTRQVVENAYHMFQAEDEADANLQVDKLLEELNSFEPEPKGLKWSIRLDLDRPDVDVLNTDVQKIVESDAVNFKEGGQ